MSETAEPYEPPRVRRLLREKGEMMREMDRLNFDRDQVMQRIGHIDKQIDEERKASQ